ncbi:MAG: hypothetical protein AAGH46_02725, partial [Bacteroidota bacterium]
MVKKLSFLLVIVVFFNCSSDDDNNSSILPVSEVNSVSTVISPNMTLEQVLASGAATVNFNETYFAIGHQQITANNQDPILMRFDNGELAWSRADYETNLSDGTGTGVIYDPTNDRLHVVFTSTGVDGPSETDYRRFTTNGWLSNYGFGG